MYATRLTLAHTVLEIAVLTAEPDFPRFGHVSAHSNTVAASRDANDEARSLVNVCEACLSKVVGDGAASGDDSALSPGHRLPSRVQASLQHKRAHDKILLRCCASTDEDTIKVSTCHIGHRHYIIGARVLGHKGLDQRDVDSM